MPVLDHQPKLTDIYRVISKIPRYPLSAQQVVGYAIKAHAPQEVIDFYRAFPADEIFSDKDDLTARSEQLDMMDFEDQPEEELRSLAG